MVKNENNTWVAALIIVIVLAFFGGYTLMRFTGGMFEGYYGFGWFFGIIAILLAIWVIYDVLVNNKRLSDGMKAFWIIFAIFFSLITAIIYYFVGRNKNNDLFRMK